MLDMLFEMIDEAKNVPLSGDKCMIERDRALDLIDDIRSQFPVELSEARKMMANRAELVASAKREADSIRKAAEDKARQLLAEDVITLQAKQKANDLKRETEERSRDLKRSANEYCEDVLRRTEEAVAAAYDEIKKSMTPRLTRIENKMKQRRWKEASSGAALSESGDHGEVGANGDLASPGQPAVLPVSQHIHGPVQHLGRLGPGQLIG